MIQKIFIWSLLVSLISVPLTVQADTAGSLLISQIQVSGLGGANDEYIEIYNPTSAGINLSGWSVQYKTSSGAFPLSVRKVLPEFNLEPLRYYLIAHTGYTGSVVADLAQSTFSLSGSDTGTTIFLSKSTEYVAAGDDANIIDKVAYGTSLSNSPEGSNALLPPTGESIKRISETNNNATDFVVGPSIPRNSLVIPEEVEEEPEEEVEQEEEEEIEEPVVYPNGVIISEILPNPEGVDSGEEWIEIFNSTNDTVKLKGWILDDSLTDAVGSKAITIGEAEIASEAYKVIPIPEGKFTLNNTNEDKIKLLWPNKEITDSVTYTGPVKEEQSWCIIGTTYQWCKPTPNKLNAKLVVPKPAEKKVTIKETEEDEAEDEEEATIDYSNFKVKIIKLLPDPDGADSGQESVTLFNEGSSSINLKGWLLDDGEVGAAIGSSALVLTNSSLAIGEELEITIPTGKFALNNSGSDTLRLFSPDKKLKDSVSYEDPDEGVSYVKNGEQWAWEGSVLHDSLDSSSIDNGLPRTGQPIYVFSFATLVAIWYIVYGLRIMKGTHEQTRSHRSISS